MISERICLLLWLCWNRLVFTSDELSQVCGWLLNGVLRALWSWESRKTVRDDTRREILYSLVCHGWWHVEVTNWSPRCSRGCCAICEFSGLSKHTCLALRAIGANLVCATWSVHLLSWRFHDLGLRLLLLYSAYLPLLGYLRVIRLSWLPCINLLNILEATYDRWYRLCGIDPAGAVDRCFKTAIALPVRLTLG